MEEKQQPLLEVAQLTKSFHQKQNYLVLDGVSFTLQENEIVGLVGASGAGKSTLVRCINFLEKPTSGTVIFDNLDLSKLSRKELCKARQSMGMIFQQFNLLMQRTALQNICFPMEIAGVKKEDA